ncbi:MAG: hypothetical protein A2885_11110 [Sphingopyxis sp. RIFCSPHIGHO2_01_FULL_65_24]|nr:MAG: hypothetical protein A2885_11110 [Sphingopyxis sp. RIFCSPHIGHO2_01_FULL_65_24]
MRRTLPFIAVAVIGAASIAPAVVATQASEPTLAKKMGLKPGQWRTVLRVTDAEITARPGESVPADAEPALRKLIGSTTETYECIGWQQPAGSALTLPGIKIDAACTFEELVADGRTLKIKGRCGSPSEGFHADMKVQAEHDDVEMTASVETIAFSEGVGLGTTVVATTTSSHVGPCPAGGPEARKNIN